MLTTPWKRTLYIVALTQFIAIAGGNMVFPFIAIYIQELGVTNKGEVALFAGLSGLTAGLAMFIFSPIWGAFADRWGRKPLMVRAFVGGTITIGLQVVIHNIYLFLVLRALQGAFSGVGSAGTGLVASTTPRENVAYALGTVQVAMFLAQIGGPLLGGIMADAIGIRTTFAISSIAFATGGLLLLVGVKEDFTPPAVRRGPWESFTTSVRDVAASKPALTMIGILFLANCMVTFSRILIPLFVEHIDPVGAGAKESSYVFAAVAVTGACAAFFVGTFAKRVGYRTALILTLAGAGLAYLPVSASTSIVMLVLTMALVGVFSGGCLPAANAILSVNTRADKQGSAFGLAGSAQALSMAVGPLLGGAVAALLGIRAVFLVIGVAGLGIAVLAALVVPKGVPEFSEAEPELVAAAE